MVLSDSEGKSLSVTGRYIFLLFALLGLLLSGCTSKYQKHAAEFSRMTLEQNNQSLLKESEHVIDFTEKGIYIFDDQLSDAADVGNISESNKMVTAYATVGPVLGGVLSGLHARKCKELGALWKPEDMRKNLEKSLGSRFSPALYDQPRVGFYYWYNEPSNFPFSSSSVVQSFAYFSPQLFGKQKISEVSVNDLIKLLEQIKSQKIFKTKIRHLGTTDVPCPPCWGNINYFDILSMEPYQEP